jgi:digalactosyldiacylglycerol synthase
VLHAAHNGLTGFEVLRQLAGAGTNTRDAPPRLVDYAPVEEDVGGLFDNHARAKSQVKVKPATRGGKG